MIMIVVLTGVSVRVQREKNTKLNYYTIAKNDYLTKKKKKIKKSGEKNVMKLLTRSLCL